MKNSSFKVIICLTFILTTLLLVGLSCGQPSKEIYEGKVIMQQVLGGGQLSEIYFDNGSKIRVYGQLHLTLNKYYTFTVIDGMQAKQIVSIGENYVREEKSNLCPY